MMEKEKIYDEMCRLMQEFEDGYLNISEGEDAEELYRLVSEIKANWADITAQGITTADAPTVDVRENVHGKWDKNKIAFHWKCSECGAAVFNNLGTVFNYTGNESLNFCPNCGARMEEE